MTGLVLFDIDQTLLKTGGAGVGALEDAGRELFGATFSTAGVQAAGSIDPVLVDLLLAQHGIERTAEHRRLLRSRYRAHLERRLAGGETRALPGAHELVDAVRRSDHLAPGLLTGNFPETGRMKLVAAGFNPGVFEVAVWGDDSPYDPPRRDHLPGIALERHLARFGVNADPRRVTVVGDTVHDVACAKAHGCRCLGVATGPVGVDALLAAGADRAVADLRETADLLGWLENVLPDMGGR